MENEGLLGLAAGFKGFAEGFERAEDQKYKRMETEAKIQAQREDRERQRMIDERTAQEKKTNEEGKEFDDRAGLAKAGFVIPELQPGQSIRSVPLSSLKINHGLLGARANATAGADPFGAKAADAALKTDEQRKRSLSPIPGYRKTEQYVGDEIEERTLRKAHTDLKKFQTTMTALKQRVKSAKPEDLANPYSDIRKAISNDLRDLQLTYKGEAFAALGVLTGPDMSILEQIIENPGTISNLISGKEGVTKRYDQALGRVNNAFNARIQSMGLEPDTPAPKGLVNGGAEGMVPKGKIAKPAGAPAPVNDLAAKQKRLEELRRKAAGQ